MNIPLFVALSVILMFSGWIYGVYQKGGAQFKADEKYLLHIQDMEASSQLLELRAQDTEKSLVYANARIEALNAHILAIRPAGTLMKRNTQVLKQQEHVRSTDSIATVHIPHVHLYVPEDGTIPR